MAGLKVWGLEEPKKEFIDDLKQQTVNIGIVHGQDGIQRVNTWMSKLKHVIIIKMSMISRTTCCMAHTLMIFAVLTCIKYVGV